VNKESIETAGRPERVVLVGVSSASRRTEGERSLKELEQLALTAGAVCVDSLLQIRPQMDAKYYIGQGKVTELKAICDEQKADMIIFDDELSPSQEKNIQKVVKDMRIMDRSALILDIFQRHARTREAKTQVELATLEYMLPRLARQWTHLERQMGGVGGARRGVGETQIELDRRMIRSRISRLKEELEKIAQQRETNRKFRSNQFNVALVGYTNAGKSTLMNLLTEAGVEVENKLFATLDTTVRTVTLDKSHSFYLSDTVGFIQKLPHQLVASFRSTLREAESADLLLKIIDISDEDFRKHLSTIDEVLEEFQVPEKRSVTIFNKLDAFSEEENISLIKKEFPEAHYISATRSIGVNRLLETIKEKMDESSQRHRILLGHDEGLLRSLIHGNTEILGMEERDDGTLYEFSCDPSVIARLEKRHGVRFREMDK